MKYVLVFGCLLISSQVEAVELSITRPFAVLKTTNAWTNPNVFQSSVTFSSGAYVDGNLVVKGSGTVMGVLISTTGFIGGSSTMTHLSLPVGSVGGPSLSLGDAITGFYTNGSQAINVAINGALAYTFGTFAGAVSFFPGLDSIYNLGNGSNRWNIGNFGTGLASPVLWGGSGTTQTLTFKPTTGAGTTGADMIFQVGNNGGTEAMRILNSGNVGIGTPGPIAALDVTANTFPLLNLKRAGAAVITAQDSTNKRWDFGVSGVVAGEFSIQDITDSLTPFHIKTNGRVGIGTTSPSSLVDVSGGSITIRGTNAGLSIAGGPATGGALCLNASNALSKCTSAVDINGDCTCP